MRFILCFALAFSPQLSWTEESKDKVVDAKFETKEAQPNPNAVWSLGLLDRKKASEFQEAELRFIQENLVGKITSTMMSSYFENPQEIKNPDPRGFWGMREAVRLTYDEIGEQLTDISKDELAQAKKMVASLFVTQQLAANGFEDLAFAEFETYISNEIALLVFYSAPFSKKRIREHVTAIFETLYANIRNRNKVFSNPVERQRLDRLNARIIKYLSDTDGIPDIIKLKNLGIGTAGLDGVVGIIGLASISTAAVAGGSIWLFKSLELAAELSRMGEELYVVGAIGASFAAFIGTVPLSLNWINNGIATSKFDRVRDLRDELGKSCIQTLEGKAP